MSFLTLPPEINSLNMLLGAGSAPMASVASAWDGLASELSSASSFFEGVTSGLVNDAWQGPAALEMAAAATPYTAWLSAAGVAAEQAASQARAVVSAFETARSMVVHPALIAGNRNSLVSLVVSNLFGQNAPAIAAMEEIYEQFWAQDIVAMLGYHGGASAAAAALTPFAKLPGQLAGAGGWVNAAATELAGLADALTKGGGIRAAVGSGSMRLGSLLAGFNLSGVLSGLQAGTGNLASLNLVTAGLSNSGSIGAVLSSGSLSSLLSSPGVSGLLSSKGVTSLLSSLNVGTGNLSAVLNQLGVTGTGAATAAAGWGHHAGSWGHGGWGQIGGSGRGFGFLSRLLNSDFVSNAISSGGVSALLSGPSVTGLLNSSAVNTLLSSTTVSTLLSSPTVSSLLSSPTVSSLLSSKAVSSLVSSLHLSNGSSLSSLLTQLGVGATGSGGASAASTLSTPWGNFSLNQITHFVETHGGLQTVLTNLSNSPAFTNWVNSGAFVSQLDNPAVTNLLSSPVVTNLVNSPSLSTLLSSSPVTSLLSSPSVGSLLSSPGLSGLLSNPSVSSLLSQVHLTNGSTLSNLLTQLGVGGTGSAAASTLSTPWGNFSLNQITQFVETHGGLQSVLNNLSSSPAFNAWVQSDALVSQLNNPAVTSLLSSPAVTTLLNGPTVSNLLSSPTVSNLLSSPSVANLLSSPSV
ncbi:PPE family protein, partial [Mycobacterium asiaticum]|uniref:PPE family protein n=1 Tax=Mycobacterium asiaticum TaxID=1790 RepID=UPI0007F01A40